MNENAMTELPEGITQEMLDEVKRAYTSFDLTCEYCVNAIRKGFRFFPAHTPTNHPNRKHCTCDACW